MEGTIGVLDHQISCIIGDLPEEREGLQDLFVDVQVQRSFADCAKSEQVKDTFDYVELARLCTEMAQKNKYQMIETFAVEVLDTLLKDPDVTSASICVRKPGAIPSAKCAFVELKKEKKG